MMDLVGTRVMMTTDAVGGVWTFSAALARALGARGCQVLLVSIGPRPTERQRGAVTACAGVKLIETDLALEWQDPGASDIRRARGQLHELAAQFAPDLIHVNGYREASFGWTVPVVLVAHSCVNSWADACDEVDAFAGDAWDTYTDLVGEGLASADAWVAPTASFRNWIAKRYGVAGNGHVIWNGVDEVTAPSSSKLPVVLAAGRIWDRAKNLASLSSVAADIDWPIRVAGATHVDGVESPSGIAHCEMLGPLAAEDMQREMQQAAIFVSPALYEPFGLAVLEAARAGCAVVLSDLASFRELWSGAALFVDPRDTDQVTHALQALCGDPAFLTRMQQAALMRSKRYTSDATVNGYSALYASLLSRRSMRESPLRDARISA